MALQSNILSARLDIDAFKETKGNHRKNYFLFKIRNGNHIDSLNYIN
jgi:hypothetical protein